MSRSRNLVLVVLLAAPLVAQELPANPDEVHPRKTEAPKPPPRANPDLSPDPDKIPPPKPGEEGESSSKETRMDLSPPAADVREHPDSYTELKPWNPHKADKDVEVGDYYFKLKNYRAAESRYREALYWEDNNAVATYKLAVTLEKLGEVEEAAHNYRAYPKLAPEGPYAADAKEALARLAPQLGPTPGTPRSDPGEDDLRLGEFNMALQNWPGAEARFRDALELKPDDAVAAFRLGQCLEKMGKPDEARGFYQQYLAALPTGPFAAEAKKGTERIPVRVAAAAQEDTSVAKAAKELEIADAYYEQKRYDAALEHYRAVLDAQPDNASALIRVAEIMESRKQLHDSLRYYRAYLKADPNGPFAIEALNALNRLSEQMRQMGEKVDDPTSSPAQSPR